MKKLLFFLLSLSILIFSCQKEIDLCEKTICFNGGRCLAGVCICESGYTGKNCETKINNGNPQNCISTDYSGPQNCNIGYVAVSNQYCCPLTYPYYGVERADCYSSCTSAKNDGNSTIVFGTGKDNSSGNPGNSNPLNGKVVFWVKSDLKCGEITVTVGNITKKITAYQNSAPLCDAIGAATFEGLESNGSVRWSAVCQGFRWGGLADGLVTFKNGECKKFELRESNIDVGIGSNPLNGKQAVRFWTTIPFKCDRIDIKLSNNQTGAIFQRNDKIPNCPYEPGIGGDTFFLKRGSYTYTANCLAAKWSGTIVIEALGGCETIELK